MAYNAFNNSEIQVGKAIVKNLWQKIKDNFDDHESRISSIIGSSGKIPVFNNTYLVGKQLFSGEVINTYRALHDFTINEVSLESYLTTGSGILTIDIVKSTSLDITGAVSILNSPLSVDFSSPDFTTVFGSLNPSNQGILTGEYLHIKILSLPILCENFRVSCLGV